MTAEPFEMVVGLEVHVQLRTRTKTFCRCPASFGDPPNQNTCPVCLALPGALPVLNAAAVDLAVTAALAFGCTVRERSVFARKNYFYPDLPKGYQISQFDQPLAEGGAVPLPGGGAVRLIRIHLEEDAGKSVHDRFAGFTAIDLNRAGVPLIEIVTAPDIRSAADVAACVRAIREMLVYAGVSDCSMEEGSLRVDANVSARPRGEPGLRTRTEIKNVNSFAFVERAVTLEFERHCARYARGEPVVQQTMLYDERADAVRPARSKEESHDYRYFPDPDLPPLVLDPARVARLRAALPEMPAARRARYVAELGVTAAEAAALTADRAIGDYFERVTSRCGDGRAAANWVLGEVLAAQRARGGQPVEAVSAERLGDLIGLVTSGVLSTSAAKKVYAAMWDDAGDARSIAQRLGLVQVGDESALQAWVDEVFAEHPDEARRLAAGERKLQGVLVGLVMKKSGGRADPRKVAQLVGARAGT